MYIVEPKRTLLNKALAHDLVQTIFSESHGAFDDHLGAGGLYYILATMNRSQVSVCIGSGGGFVPRLLRQAQEDLGLTEAHTYLIDANLPDLGFGHPMQEGGWLTASNDLQTENPGLSVLRMLSRDAAQLFASAGMTIDYLHIDGDHSTRGVIADVSDFLPLLSHGAIVSLHDLRMEAVRRAMEEIGAKHPALEWITFYEIGNGTAIMRRRPTQLPAPLPPSLQSMPLPRRVVRFDKVVAASETGQSQAKARYERWHYLATSAYRTRYDLIAKAIDLAEFTVVELGGYPNSIVGHVTLARRVVAIEPYAPPDYLAQVQSAAAERGIDLLVRRGVLGQVPLDPGLLGPYAFVALGLDVSAGCDTIEEFRNALLSLVELAGHAQIVAVEAPGYPPSQVALHCILACIEHETVLDISLDMSSDPVAFEYFVQDERAKRRVLVFRPRQLVGPQLRDRITTNAAAYFQNFKTGSPVPAADGLIFGLPTRIKPYRFGDTIHFQRGSGAQHYLISGWSNPEAEHVWGLGKVSRLELEISGLADNARPLVLRLDVVVFIRLGKLQTQRLAVILNGERVFKGRLRSGGLLDIPVTRKALLARNPATLVLIHPDGARPMDLSETSRDSRVLSAGLRSMVISYSAQTG